MRYLLTIFLILGQFQYAKATDEIQILLQELDRTLESKPLFAAQKEQQLGRLKEQLSREVSLSKQFELCYDIINEYKSYKCDSALVYIDRNLLLAEKKENNVWKARTILQYSFVLSSSGLFRESEIVLNMIEKDKLDEDLLVEYYKCQIQLFSNLSDYLNDNRFSLEHRAKLNSLQDSIYTHLPSSSTERIYYESLLTLRKGDLEKALLLANSYINTLQPESHEYAKKNFYIGSIYRSKGYTHDWIKHIIIAAIADAKDAVKENLALITLTSWLYEQNDIERAYIYIQHALNDANFYNARLRNFQISRILPIINEAYQVHKEEQQSYLKVALIIISTTFLLLLITVFYLMKQKSTLSKTRLKLRETNKNLEKMNDQLNILNQELSEANLIKEEYIGHFMDLYSSYINKMDEYRRMINTKIAAKRFDELSKITFSSRGKDSEVKELYNNFDQAFLNIYPGFVEAFNQLLKEEERFELRKGELLNTEIRVFALIRLGITDSTKIAEFLRCSLQTVYNYRSKIKKKSCKEDDDIEELIRKIGK